MLEELGDEESLLSLIKTAYDLSMGAQMQAVADGYERNKPPIQTLRALVVQRDKRLRDMTRVIMTKEMLVRRLTAQADIYREQITRLSRVQSLREAEARL